MSRDYGRVSTNFWNSPDIRCLSDEGKLLAQYLITGPHSNLIGAYLLPDAYVTDDLGWSPGTVSKAFAELFANGFAIRFRDGRHVCVIKFLIWNPIVNPNSGKAALKLLDQLPNDPALQHVYDGLMLYRKQFPNGLETVRERLAKPFRYIETGTGTESGTGAGTESLALRARCECAADFQTFYETYPRKEARKGAEQEFTRIIKKKEATAADLIAGAERYAADCKDKNTERRFIKLPTTWLKNGCWTDEHSAPDRPRTGFAAGAQAIDRVLRRGGDNGE